MAAPLGLVLAAGLALPRPASAQDGSLDEARAAAGKMESVQGAPAVKPLYVSFTLEGPAEEPDRTELRPGPAGGPELVYGYTDASVRYRLHKPRWVEGAAGEDGLVPVHAEAARVYYTLAQKIYVTSAFPPEGCPSRAVLKHERSHARAFAAIYRSSHASLSKALAQALEAEPRAGTADKPVRLEASAVAGHQKAVEARLAAALVGQLEGEGGLAELFEKDREAKDSAKSYLAVYDSCQDEDWKQALKRLRAETKKSEARRAPD